MQTHRCVSLGVVLYRLEIVIKIFLGLFDCLGVEIAVDKYGAEKYVGRYPEHVAEDITSVGNKAAVENAERNPEAKQLLAICNTYTERGGIKLVKRLSHLTYGGNALAASPDNAAEHLTENIVLGGKRQLKEKREGFHLEFFCMYVGKPNIVGDLDLFWYH